MPLSLKLFLLTIFMGLVLAYAQTPTKDKTPTGSTTAGPGITATAEQGTTKTAEKVSSANGVFTNLTYLLVLMALIMQLLRTRVGNDGL